MPQRLGRMSNQRLREERLRCGWTQQYLADCIGTTPNNISRWELGVTTPGPYFRKKLSDLFGRSTQALGLDSHVVEEDMGPAPQIEQDISPAHHVSSPSIWRIPLRRNPFFTGREAVLTRLRTFLNSERRTALSQMQALCGLGGIGKTQTALEYASRYRKFYQVVLWVQADTYEMLVSELGVIAGLLQLPEANEQDQHKSVEAVRRWLDEQSGWLLILDNVEDMTMLSDVLPTGERGHLLLTTRTQITGTLTERVDLGQMEPEEGAFLLLRRAKLITLDTPWEDIPAGLRDDARAIAELLGGLPLALDQAGAYLEETACRLSDYLDYYRVRCTSLLARRGEPGTDHPESVAITFTLLIEQVEQAHPAAADLLRLCAFFHPDAIPEELFKMHTDALGPGMQPVGTDLLVWDAMINVLRKFSLVQRDVETRTISIHQLVQAVIRESMDEHARYQWGERAIQVLNRLFPDMDTSPSWHRYFRYLPHAQSCSVFIMQWPIVTTEAAQLLYQTGRALHKSGRFSQAERFYERALAIRQHILGPDHFTVAQSLNALGVLYFSLNRYLQAESLLQQSLAILEQAAGPAHPDAATCLNALGLLANFQDNYHQARSLLQQALSIREQAFGSHLLVAQSVANLGSLYLDYGQYAQAEEYLGQAQTYFERILGPEHPDLVVNLNALAMLFVKQGRYLQAESLCCRALALIEQHFGPEHPRLADTLTILADLSERRGDPEEVERLCQRAVALSERANGPQHPSLCNTLTIMARVYAGRGEYERSESLCQRILTIFEQSFGVGHPFTVEALNILGRLYGRQGNDEQAESVLLQALAIHERIPGIEYPEMVYSLILLATLFLKQGKLAQADLLYRRVLTLLERTVGSEHPDTAQSLAGLAQLYQSWGKDMQAGTLYRWALAIWEKTVGPNHTRVAWCLERYNSLHRRSESRERAEAEPGCATDTQRSTSLVMDVVGRVPTVQRGTDPLIPFLSRYCLFDPQAWCSAHDLWQAYQHWIQESGERFPLSRRVFAGYLKARGAVPDRTKIRRIWRGIALSEWEREVTQGDAK